MLYSMWTFAFKIGTRIQIAVRVLIKCVQGKSYGCSRTAVSLTIRGHGYTKQSELLLSSIRLNMLVTGKPQSVGKFTNE